MSTGRVILVALATVVIFATGVITGGLLVRKTSVAALPPPPPMMFPGRFDAIRRATEQIPDLTSDQRQHINGIIRNSQEHIADFFLLFEPDIQDVFRKMREDIRAELNLEQRRRLEEFLRMRPRPGPGFPPFGPGPGGPGDGMRRFRPGGPGGPGPGGPGGPPPRERETPPPPRVDSSPAPNPPPAPAEK